MYGRENNQRNAVYSPSEHNSTNEPNPTHRGVGEEEPIMLEWYLPLVKDWNKSFDSAFQSGYEKAQADIYALLTEDITPEDFDLKSHPPMDTGYSN